MVLLACSRERDFDEVFPPPRPIGSSQAPERPPALRYEFAPGSEVEFRIGSSRSGRARGRLPLAGGGLTVDSFDLGLTRGHAVFDLGELELKDEVPAGVENAGSSWQAASLTEHALAWLELDGSAVAQAHPEYRYARFTIRSVGGLGSVSAHDGDPVRSDASRLRRRVRLDASGELELHGVRYPYTAPLDVIFEWSPAGPGGRSPSRIEIATREGVNLDLGAHSIVPRRRGGEVDGDALAQLRKGSGLLLLATARWVAVPTSTPAGR